MDTRSQPEEATFSVVVTRADGRVEDLGVVSYWHRRWWKRLIMRLRMQWRRWRR